MGKLAEARVVLRGVDHLIHIVVVLGLKIWVESKCNILLKIKKWKLREERASPPGPG